MVKLKESIFVSAFCALNVGDDLFLKILFSRYPNQRFIIVAPPKYLHIFDNNDNVTVLIMGIWFKIINKCVKFFFRCTLVSLLARCSKAAVLIGGSIFKEPVLPDCRPSGKTPFFVIGANYGPASSLQYKNKCINFFKECTSVCFRDQKSYQTFSELDNVSVAADVVFSLTNLKIGSSGKTIKNSSGTVVFSLIDLSNPEHKEISQFEKKYLESMLSTCKDFIRKGKRIIILSFCGEQDDDRAALSLLKRLSGEERENVSHILYSGNVEEVLDVIKSADYVVGTRFHSIVLGLLFSKQVIPICYSNKSRELLNDLNYHNYYDMSNLPNPSKGFFFFQLDEDIRKRLEDSSQKQFRAFEKFLND